MMNLKHRRKVKHLLTKEEWRECRKTTNESRQRDRKTLKEWRRKKVAKVAKYALARHIFDTISSCPEWSLYNKYTHKHFDEDITLFKAYWIFYSIKGWLRIKTLDGEVVDGNPKLHELFIREAAGIIKDNQKYWDETL